MEKFNEYAVQDPRGSESSIKPEREGIDEGELHHHPEEKEPRVPTVTPQTDDRDTVNPLQEPDTESSGFKKENLIPVKNTDQEEEEEDEEDDEEEEDDVDREEEQYERGRDAYSNGPGDEFSSPANPNDTNFEDPAKDRKTDPMTDHEPRIAGI